MLDALGFAIARVLSYSAATMIPLAGSCRQSQCHMLCIHSQPQEKGSITHKTPLFPFLNFFFCFLVPFLCLLGPPAINAAVPPVRYSGMLLLRCCFGAVPQPSLAHSLLLGQPGKANLVSSLQWY